MEQFVDGKKACVRTALELIRDGMVIGLGGGSTVALLIREIAERKLNIQAVTPSQSTMEQCIRHQIPVLPLELTTRIDVAFDGCDELDAELNALKSCGGIHTREKLIASMAEEYILFADDSKWKEKLAFAHPVTVEILPPARAFVEKKMKEMGATVTERWSDKKDGLVISDDGNYLAEAIFSDTSDLRGLSASLDKVPGLVGHSLFVDIASKAIIAKKDGLVEIIKKTEKENGQ